MQPIEKKEALVNQLLPVVRLLEQYKGSPARPILALLIKTTPLFFPQLPILEFVPPLYESIEICLEQVESTIKDFIDELYSDKLAYPFDQPNLDIPFADPDFVNCCMATFDAAKGSTSEKVKNFARLLKSALKSNLISNFDMYYEYLDSLRQLSMRELAVLEKLEFFEKAWGVYGDPNAKPVEPEKWDQFVNGIVKDFDIPPDETAAFLIRLTRTGCYEDFAGRFLDHKYGHGRLTPMYTRLKRLIESQENISSNV